MTDLPLHDQAEAILDVEHDIRDLETQLSVLKANLATRELALANAMVEQCVPFFGYGDKRWTVDSSTYIKPASGESQAVVDWIVANGGEDLVKPNMHHQRRDAFLRERFLDDDGCLLALPDELVGKVDVTTLPKVSRRKA